MKMGEDTRELFFYETFLYYNPLLLIVSYFSTLISESNSLRVFPNVCHFFQTLMVWLWGVNLWVFSRSGVDYAAIFYLGPDHLSHREIWKVYNS